MAKIKAIELSEEQRAALEKGCKHGPSHAFRQRCRMIPLKAQWLTSQQVAEQVGCCEVVVNTWLARYQAGGLDGLKTRRGQGRRPILQADADLAPCAGRCRTTASASASPKPSWSRS